MNEDPPMLPEGPRPLPQWAWLLSVLFFPAGVFIAFGFARVLPWMRSIAFALISYACIIGFVQLMSQLESTKASYIARTSALAGGLLMFSLWGYALYHIGERASYWLPIERRDWRRGGLFAAFLLCLLLACIALNLILLCLQAAGYMPRTNLP